MTILLLSKVTESSVLKDKARPPEPGETWVSIWVLLVVSVGFSNQPVSFTIRIAMALPNQPTDEERLALKERKYTRSKAGLLPGGIASLALWGFVINKTARKAIAISVLLAYTLWCFIIVCWMSTTLCRWKNLSFCGTEEILSIKCQSKEI